MSNYGRAMGLVFGFPSCCITAFCNNRSNLAENSQAHGTGYMPCKTCNDVIEDVGLPEFVKTVIAPRRKLSTPFPKNRNEEEFERLFKETLIFLEDENPICIDCGQQIGRDNCGCPTPTNTETSNE